MAPATTTVPAITEPTTRAAATTAATTTTAPQPATDPQFQLEGQGLAQVGQVGDAAEPMIDAAAAAFGPPASDSGWVTDHDCFFEGGLRTVTWQDPGLRLEFADGDTFVGTGPHLVWFATVGPDDAPWQVAGLTRGTTFGAIFDVFPDAEVLRGPDLDFVQFSPDGLLYGWIGADQTIADFWGGIEFCVSP